MTWVWLSLLCAFSQATSDAATKAWLQGFTARELTLVRFGVSGLLLLPFLLIGMPSLTDLPLAFWGWLVILVPLELVAMILYMAAIRDYPLSLTVPYLAFSPVFVIGIAWVLLGEHVSWLGFCGVLLVVAGAWLLHLDKVDIHDWRSWMAPFMAIIHEPGSRMMLVVSIIYAVTATLGKVAMQYMDPSHFAAFYYVLIAIAVLVFIAPPRLRTLRKLASRPVAVFVVGFFMGAMVYTHFTAIQMAEAAYMVAIKRTSLLFGILYGAWLFHESGLRSRIPAGLIMIAGVALIAL